MNALNGYESSGEVESGKSVKLAQAIEVMQIVHDTKDAVTDVAKKLAEHMKAEELDRRAFVSELHDIRLAIQGVDQKIEVISEELQVDLEKSKSEVRSKIVSELESNIRSLKTELRDDMKEVKSELKSIFNRLEQVERGLTRNNEWIDLGKRVAFTITGALTLGILVLMGLNLK